MRLKHPQFTPEEDAMILAQSRGELSVHALEKQIHRGHRSIHARAEQLGITLIRRKQSGGHNSGPRGRRYVIKPTKSMEIIDPEMADDGSSNPCRAYKKGSEDPLLARLLEGGR